MEIPFPCLPDCGKIRTKERNYFDLISINRVISVIETHILIIIIICLLKIKVIYYFDRADKCFNSSLHTATVNLVKTKSILHDYNFICIITQEREWVGILLWNFSLFHFAGIVSTWYFILNIKNNHGRYWCMKSVPPHSVRYVNVSLDHTESLLSWLYIYGKNHDFVEIF